VVAFSDSATISTLVAEGRPDLYGRVRIGGTIGWALSAPIVGALVEANGLKAAWWAYAGLMAAGLLVALRFRFPAVSARPSLLAGLRAMGGDRKWLYFLAMCLVAGMGFTSVNSFLYAYMQEIGASASLMGLSLTLSTVSEVPVMLFGHRLLARFGARGMFVLAVVATGVRLLLYAVFATPAGVLGFQLINGLTFPMAWIAGVAWANENAPRHMESTAQGVFGATVTGVGAAAGGLLAGVLFGEIGGRGMFYVFAALVLTGVAVLSWLERGFGAKIKTTR
jgi:MFS transporter, PPP family, 3-phenylpropionic acid transporter